MNTSLIRLLVAFAWLAAFGQGAFAAVTFTVTPTAVSNTYTGTISLVITGLTNKTVVIQKFLDLNNNGVIDSGDILVQQFTLKDGTNFVIGGVTNFNVPGDLNATTGAITATLNFQSGDFMQNVVGNYLYELSQPKGGFTPITNSFSVTNFPFPQTFTGNVVSNGTSTTVSNAVVLLFPPPRPGHNGPGGSPLAGVVANNAGNYTVWVPPGTYVPMAFRSNYVANYTASPVLTLAASQTITTNLTLTNATASISGSVVDASSSVGLPGVLVPAMSANGLIAVAFTDTNGNFNVGVTAGTWGIKADDTTLIVHGYLGLQNGTNVTAGATNVTLAVPEATALFYGSVKDNLGNPLTGLDVYANDNNYNLYETDGYTDANGNYVVGVPGGLGTDDPWYVQANGNNTLTNYLFSQPDFDQNGGTNINVGQAVLVNFTALLATNNISGSLKDNNNNPIGGVWIWANATINGTDYQAGVDTDNTGYYSFNAANGAWTVGVSSGGGGDSLPGNYLSPANQSVVISNNNATVNFTAIPATNHITGYLINAATGLGIANVGVPAWATINGVQYMQYARTDNNGFYSNIVANGTWSVDVNCGDCSDCLSSSLYQCPDNQTAVINNNNATNNFTVQPCGVTITTTSGSWLGNQFQMRLTGATGQNYTIQMSTNLSFTNWTTLLITNNATTNSFNVIDLNATNKQSFYRVLVGP